MKCECVTKHSGSFSFIKHVQHSHINSTMSTKLMKVLCIFFAWIHKHEQRGWWHMEGLCNIFLILTALLLPSHNCVNGRELLQQDFKQIFFKIQTHQILWKWFLSSNERDLLYSNTTLKWTFPLHPAEQILNCCDCWQTVYKLDTHVPCTPNISPPASNVIKQHSVWFQILCVWLQDLSKVPLGYQLFFLHYFSVVDAG